MANNALLFRWCAKFDAWKTNMEPEYVRDSKEIERFFRTHTLQIELLNRKIKSLDEEFLMYNDGVPVSAPSGEPVFKDPSKVNEYKERLTEIMQMPVTLTYAGTTI